MWCFVCNDTMKGQRFRYIFKVLRATPRSQKVSDEFTLPLCVAYHNELHASGTEISWWRNQGIEPLSIASELWRASTSMAADGRTGA